ncbi:hypothetical protein [Thermomonospora catenispora]|nr:hypothetical protein [Thermomonospora catenispora]
MFPTADLETRAEFVPSSALSAVFSTVVTAARKASSDAFDGLRR